MNAPLVSACLWIAAYLVAGIPGVLVMLAFGIAGEALLFGSEMLGGRRRG